MTPKKKTKNGKKKDQDLEAAARPSPTKAIRTVADLREDKDIWYKICVLIYDLRNAKDKTSENRTLQTTDELYLSMPYFSPDEAAAIKAARLDDGHTLEHAITTSLQNFFEKRRASGDCRPCGPHDMVPVYMTCFGIEKSEIEDEKLLSRIRRSGLKTT
ncbi:unnamed protein product [Periconia digitata]|uniref:Uncharacterized protein n=1 Tax=Periconia digitata TaxID=1303443 RepID=A0A9W4UCJ5_9PLEO|nr:unnamed protein product [Periconia digitata]